MHVLHIFNEINFSGAEIMYQNAAPLFQKEGIKMTAVSTGKHRGNYCDHFEKAGIRIFHKPFPRANRNPAFLVRYFRDIYNFILIEKVDVVHIHRLDVFWFYSLSARMAGKKSVMTTHNVYKNRKITLPKARLERMIARKLFRVTFQTIGESVYKNELQYYKNPSVKINNWYNEEKFFPASSVAEKNSKRKELGIREEDFVIISAGSCSEIKNHTDIIRSMALAIKQAPCVYLHLGTGHKEEEEKEKSSELHVRENIQFLGNRTNVRDYLIAADVFIMPSRFEGLSIAAIEAMGCRLPGILYNSPGLVDLIHNDDNGFLIEHDHTAIAEKIVLLFQNPALALEKGTNAYTFVKSNFNMQKSVQKIIGLYRNN